MSRKPFPKKEVEKLMDSLAEQGCLVKAVKAGYWVGFPDGKTSTTVHLSQSDTRSFKNTRAHILRAGLTWPL